MVTDSPATLRGLKILVSAVRFRPWPYSHLVSFNYLQSDHSAIQVGFRLYLPELCYFCDAWCIRLVNEEALALRSSKRVMTLPQFHYTQQRQKYSQAASDFSLTQVFLVKLIEWVYVGVEQLWHYSCANVYNHCAERAGAGGSSHRQSNSDFAFTFRVSIRGF